MNPGIKKEDLLAYAIKPVNERLGMGSKSAENLLLGTAAHESLMGHFLKQVGGPALGIYQEEPASHADLYNNYLSYHPIIKERLDRLSTTVSILGREKELITNLQYATAIARLTYYRVAEKLPEADDLDGLAKYWKKYYNTELGKGSIEDFKYHYKEFVLEG